MLGIVSLLKLQFCMCKPRMDHEEMNKVINLVAYITYNTPIIGVKEVP